MVSTTDIVNMLEDDSFKRLVAEILAAVDRAQCRPTGTANITCDALLFATAVITEASPQYDGIAGLEKANQMIRDETKVMLQLLRKHSARHGGSLLLTLTPSRTLN